MHIHSSVKYFASSVLCLKCDVNKVELNVKRQNLCCGYLWSNIGLAAMSTDLEQ